ncbi:MAG TPA: TRAP transporter small permease [Geminicoccaceae bacterium]
MAEPAVSGPEGPRGSDEDRSALARADRLVWRIERMFALISALFIFGLMLIGVVQIAGRKFFNAPIFGYIDIVELTMTIFAFLAISYCERIGGHVRMELLLGKLRGRALWIAELLGVLVALFVIGVLIWFGYDHTIRAYELGDTTIDAHYPWWPSKAMVPIAFSLLWLRLLLMAWGFARLIVDPERTPVGVPLTGDIRRLAEQEALEAHALDDDQHPAAAGPGSGPR